jgi:hypothetical protein
MRFRLAPSCSGSQQVVESCDRRSGGLGKWNMVSSLRVALSRCPQSRETATVAFMLGQSTSSPPWAVPRWLSIGQGRGVFGHNSDPRRMALWRNAVRV